MLAASAEDAENPEPSPSQQEEEDAPAAADRQELAAPSAVPVHLAVSDGPVIGSVSMGADSIANVVGGQLAGAAGFKAPTYTPSIPETQFLPSQIPRNVPTQQSNEGMLALLSLVSP